MVATCAFEESQGPAMLRWVDAGGACERDVFAGRFDARASAAWEGVTVLDGVVEPYERTEGHFPRHVVSIHRGGLAPFEARVSGGRWYASASRPGLVNVWPAGVSHAVRWLRPASWCVIQIDARFVADLATSLGMAASPELRPSIGVSDPVLTQLGAALALALAPGEGNAAGRLVRESLGTALVGHLLRAHTGAPPARRLARRSPGARLPPATLRALVDHVEARMASELPLRDLAAVAGMDVFGFSRAFKATTGEPPHRFVLHARLDRAKVLLRDATLPISDIALRTGFATPSHFAAMFRRATGLTPGAWRAGR
jgi:AraC family transcriptional regulator